MSSPVAIPTPELSGSHSPSGLKRRHPDADERDEEGKRPRVDGPGNDTEARDVVNGSQRPSEPSANAEQPAAKDEPSSTREPRNRGMGVEEKKRSKRLFGALLGNLNQPSDRVAKKRQEIESRRKAELQQQDDERLVDKRRRFVELTEHRKTVQRKVNEDNMRVRHRHMLHAASSLQTLAEPRLYYRPWDLRPDEEDRIADQLRDTRAQIDRELLRVKDGGHDGSHSTRNNDEAATEHAAAANHDPEAELRDTNMSSDDTGISNAEAGAQAKSAEDAQHEPAAASNSDSHHEDTNTKSSSLAADDKGDLAGDSASKAHVFADDEGDHVVEGDEDTVIY